MIDETRLEVFVPFVPVNALNAREPHWARAKRTRRERDQVAMAVWVALRDRRDHCRWQLIAPPERPKAIVFTVHGARLFDDDALGAICKAARDACQDIGLIHDDGPASGHTFAYTQVVDGRRGISLAVTCR